MNPKERLYSFFPILQRPGRYLDHELNAYRKPWGKCALRILLVYPDTYEVGMSHLGHRLIYHILNKIEGVLADRAYLPWVDALEVMSKEGIPLWGLETGRPAADFHILEVSLQHELLYTNLLHVLRHSFIPTRARDRREGDPIVIAGGAAMVNPVPVAPFVDLVFVGESEDAQVEIAQVMLSALNDGVSREEVVERLAKIEGMWAPSLGGKVKRRIVLDLDKAFSPGKVLMPWISVVHERLTVEIMRGCSRGCRFCQAGYQYRPVRERSVSAILRLAQEGLESTGYDEISLLSLSATDHSRIQDIIKALMKAGGKSFVSLSLPSLRSGTLTGELLEEIARVRKTGFTMAPEAGTQRLRDVINKNVTEDEIMETVDKVFSAGWDLMKLYFMIGLPTETQEDVEAIAHLVRRVMERARRASYRRPRLRVSVSPFVPKPHTPFQWEPQDTLESLRQKITILRRLIPKKGIELSIHNPYQSLIEALLSRGGEETQGLLEAVHRRGAVFDQWRECFNYFLWQEAIREVGIDIGHTLHRAREWDEPLPWDFVEMGFSKEFLWAEREKAMKGITTPDCREVCAGCGVCKGGIGHLSSRDDTGTITLYPFSREVHCRLRVWLRFRGDGALVGHNHFMQAFIYLLRRSGVPLAYRGRFNPRARVSFALALPLGMESEAEPCELFLTTHVKKGLVAERLNSLLPRGIRVVREEEVPLDAPSLSKAVKAIEYRVQVPKEILTAPFPKDLASELACIEGMAGLEVYPEERAFSFVALPVKGDFVKPYQLVKDHLPVEKGKERAAKVVRRVVLAEGSA